jgi:hypothetical protein
VTGAAGDVVERLTYGACGPAQDVAGASTPFAGPREGGLMGLALFPEFENKGRRATCDGPPISSRAPRTLCLLPRRALQRGPTRHTVAYTACTRRSLK